MEIVVVDSGLFEIENFEVILLYLGATFGKHSRPLIDRRIRNLMFQYKFLIFLL